ncbi:MAG: GTPase [Roseburia sp.]|nr:GTPase [Roseburia sp.]
MEEIPIYLFTGFMDSGKTSLVKETLFENGFADGSKSLIICCEDGETEYDAEALAAKNVRLVMVEKEEDLTTEFLQSVNLEYLPDQIFLEYNGTWKLDTILETPLPKGWIIVQELATVDATTFELYLNNMRTMIMEQLFHADVVIFNRCDDSTDKGKFRRNVKALNRKAQLVYERADGSLDEREEELPFDISGDELEITDADYAIWYMDCLENPKRYEGKKVHFLALVYNPERLKKGVFVPGRFAMTCCVEDVTFIGFKCKYAKEEEIPHRSWIDITAEVRVEFAKEYKGKGPVLYPVSVVLAEAPEDELVYFS